MSHPTIGFIGGGRVARILLGGWRHAGVELSDVVVTEPDDAAFAALEAAVPAIPLVRRGAAEVAQQSLVLLAVHPPKLLEAAASFAGALASKTIVVSLAPKITLQNLQEALGEFARLARLIPNAPSLVGRGFNPIAWGDALSTQDKNSLRTMFTPLGELPEVPEAALEAYAILAAMGPTYFWPQWLELEALGGEFGLSAADASVAVKAMIQGAVELLASSGMPPASVLDLIPVKPLADFEPELRAAYRSRLSATFEKIRPVEKRSCRHEC
jgi:pyrroline-5-carboxylate reductase